MAYHNTYYLLLDAALADTGHVLRKVDGAALRRLREMIRTAARVVVAGDDHGGLVMRLLALYLTGLGLPAVACDAVSGLALAEGDLLLLGSLAGNETALIQRADHAREVGAQVALITGNMRSLLAARADHMIALELPLQADTALFAQVLVILIDIQRVQLADDLTREAEEA